MTGSMREPSVLGGDDFSGIVRWAISSKGVTHFKYVTASESERAGYGTDGEEAGDSPYVRCRGTAQGPLRGCWDSSGQTVPHGETVC